MKQDGQYGCSVLGTDLYGSRPMYSIELFLEYNFSLTVAVSRLMEGMSMSVAHTN